MQICTSALLVPPTMLHLCIDAGLDICQTSFQAWYWVLQEGPEGWPRVIDIYFEHNLTVAKPIEPSITIKDSGMYYLWFVNCDEDLSAATVAGQTVWKNPGGYLPGMMFPHITFFAVMTLVYLTLMILWGLLYARHWNDIFMLQHFMTAVIVMGMLEMSAWYFDYINFNASGRRPVLPTLWAVLMGSLRKTVARTLIVMVSMGYGMVLPFLSDLQKKVSLLSRIEQHTLSFLQPCNGNP